MGVTFSGLDAIAALASGDLFVADDVSESKTTKVTMAQLISFIESTGLSNIPLNSGAGLAATSDEINTTCDGNTATAAEITQVCDGCLATAAELNELAGQGVTAAQFGLLAGINATAAEVNAACDVSAGAWAQSEIASDTASSVSITPVDALVQTLVFSVGTLAVGDVILIAVQNTVTKGGTAGLTRHNASVDIGSTGVLGIFTSFGNYDTFYQPASATSYNDHLFYGVCTSAGTIDIRFQTLSSGSTATLDAINVYAYRLRKG